mgnify:CR=1 FL=1
MLNTPIQKISALCCLLVSTLLLPPLRVNSIFAGTQPTDLPFSFFLPLVSRDCNADFVITSVMHSHLSASHVKSNEAIGEVSNTQIDVAQNFTVTLNFISTINLQTTSISTHALLPELRKGESAPFKLTWFSPSYENYNGPYEILISCGPATSLSTYNHLNPLSVNFDNQTDFPIISGTVRNDSTQTLNSLAVAATIKANDGTLLDAAGYQVDQMIAPSQTVTYTMRLNKVYSNFADITAANISVAAQGKIAP